MSEKEQMSLLVKNAQEALGRLQSVIQIPELWLEFQDAFNAAFRLANGFADALEKSNQETPKLRDALERTTTAYTSLQEKVKGRESELKAIYGPVHEENANLRREIGRLTDTIAEYKTHPAVIEAELSKQQAEIEATEKRLLALKVSAAEKAAAIKQANPIQETVQES